jgi:RNA polymerase sigma-70 factor (ECF subfamily)
VPILRVVDEQRATEAASAVSSAALTDDEVIARVRAGDTGLFEVIMRRYNQRLFRVVRSVVRADDEAEDVVQQAYVSAYTHLAQFAGHAQFATWLTRIAINEGLARVRQRAREPELNLKEEDETMQQPIVPHTPEDDASQREMGHILERAIDELPTIYRVVFVMRELEQMSTAEAASALEITEETIKVRLHRAKGLLRNSISMRMEESMPQAFPFLGQRCDKIVHAVLSLLSSRPPPVGPS